MQYFAEIPKEKFTKYALDPLKQPDKARAFREALGYTIDNYQELIDNISANLDESALKLKGSNDHGQLYEYVMRITGANGKQANVCTGWIIENGKTEPRLTSAYVTEKKVTIELYDTVLLKDGRKGSVVDRIGDDYVVDVDTGGDFETKLISPSEIVRIIA